MTTKAAVLRPPVLPTPDWIGVGEHQSWPAEFGIQSQRRAFFIVTEQSVSSFSGFGFWCLVWESLSAPRM